MVDATSIFDRVCKCSSVGPSSDSGAHCRFRTACSMTRFSLCTLACPALDTAAEHGLTAMVREFD